MSEGPILLQQKDNKYTKIFVGGLPYHTTDDTLSDFFLKFGDIEEAVVIYDRATRKSKGYGFVTMKNKDGAEKAVADPNPFIDGRKANVNLAYLGAKPKGHSQPGSPMSGFSTGRSNSPSTHFHPQNSPPLPLPGPGFFLHSPAPPPHFFHHEGTPPFSPPPLINPMLLPNPFFSGAPHPPPFGFVPGHHPYIEPHNQHQLIPQMVPFNVAN